jgi:hypothetical protein
VHLVNYRSDGPLENVAVRLRLPREQRAKAVTLVDPQRQAEIELPFRQQAGVVAFEVPQVNVYGIAVIAME